MKDKIKDLTTILGMGGLNGTIAIAAVEGFFKMENAIVIASLFLAGPGAILVAALTQGNTQERMVVALVSGILATGITMFAAGFGPTLLGFVNLNVLKITGGIAIAVIALIVAGVNVPSNIPFFVIILGIIGGLIVK
tara:strand:- start:4566 stop:4976 length:411 start_codon:yes stop_codon:yes gene_type:complete